MPPKPMFPPTVYTLKPKAIFSMIRNVFLNKMCNLIEAHLY